MSGVMLIASCFPFFMVSALVPWVNGEILMLGYAALAPSPVYLAGIAILATAGQMAGKCILYWAGRGVIPIKKGRVAEVVNAWKGRFERSSKKTWGLVFVSAASGFPPFYVMSILVGAFRLRFPLFVAIGSCGRFVHFGTIALIPQFGGRYFDPIGNYLKSVL
jgi:membrane protein YqaA with SNARE-associated domain